MILKSIVLGNKRNFNTESCLVKKEAVWDEKNVATIMTRKKWWLILDKPMQNSQNKAVEHMKSVRKVTADVLNSILFMFNLHTTDEGLKLLVNLPRLIFNCLHKDLYRDPYFIEKLGKMNGKEVAGVYIFTHKETGSKYVGSSIQLATRLQRYLSNTYVEYGKFLPFLTKEGLDKFTLEVIPIYSSLILKPELILEQYYLLDSSFNLNVSRVANVPGFRSKEIFMYNRDKTVLIYHLGSIKDFFIKFDIWHATIVNNIETGSLYLGKYVFSPFPVFTAKDGKFSEEEVKEMLAKDRKNTTLFMYNKDKSILFFSGLKNDFSLLGIYTSNTGVSRYINSELLYLGKYILTTSEILTASTSDISLPKLVEALNKDRQYLDVPTGKGKKVVLFDVKTNKILTFKSLTASSKFFRNIGFKPTGNTIRSCIVSGGEYNGYIIKWDEDQICVHHRANIISITNMDTGEVSVYNSIRAAERNTKIWRETLKKYANSKKPYKHLRIAYIE